MRRYDANHLTQRPKQKVTATKLLVTAEDAPEDKGHQIFLPPRFKYRHHAGSFASSGYCNHIVAENAGVKFVSAAASIARAAALK